MHKLSDLHSEHSGLIHELTASGVFRERLHGMGLLPGRRISVIRTGIPMIVDVCGGRIALDRELAQQITLTDVVAHGTSEGAGP